MKLICILLLACVPTAIFAQANYHEGYVVKNNGDTLKGFINRREWGICPVSIDFRTSPGDKETMHFAPQTIREFQVSGGETYITYKGMISLDRTKFPDLPSTLDTNKKIDTIFIKQISKGQYLTLFYHEDAIKKRFFIAETGTLPVELKYAQYYVAENQVRVNDDYKKQLAYYAGRFASGSSGLIQNIKDCSFNQPDLEKVIAAINGNTSIAKKEANFRFFAGLGLNQTTTHFYDNLESIAVQVTEATITNTVIQQQRISAYSTTTAPRLNLGADLFINPDVQQFIFRAELSLFYANPKFQYMVFDRPSYSNIPATTSFDQYSATLTPQLLFNFYNSNSFKAYVDLGIGLNFSVYSNPKLTTGTSGDLNSYWTNFPIQLGVVLHKNVEFSFSYAGYVDYTSFAENYGISSQTMQLGVKYLFH